MTDRTLLTEAQITEGLAALPEWTREGGSIVRTAETASFPTAIAVVDTVALAAEQLDHHPDIDIRWRTLRFVLSTHSAGWPHRPRPHHGRPHRPGTARPLTPRRTPPGCPKSAGSGRDAPEGVRCWHPHHAVGRTDRMAQDYPGPAGQDPVGYDYQPGWYPTQEQPQYQPQEQYAGHQQYYDPSPYAPTTTRSRRPHRPSSPRCRLRPCPCRRPRRRRRRPPPRRPSPCRRRDAARPAPPPRGRARVREGPGQGHRQDLRRSPVDRVKELVGSALSGEHAPGKARPADPRRRGRRRPRRAGPPPR
ncbi:hypothetical protein GCM10020229_81250 [Kitasatospora albolonga]